MIYEETYHFMLTNVSSTEFDACLYSLLKLDWDGYVRTTPNQMAKKIGTTTKYMREILKKFMSTKKGRHVLVPESSVDGELLRFNITKPHNLGFNPLTDRYCKKYSFFYTNEFRELSINAKRLLLMGAFRMSVSKSELVSIPVEEIVPNSQNGGILPFTKQRLYLAIQEIQSTLNKVVDIHSASSRMNQREAVFFSFKPGTLNDYMENHTERELLRRKLYEAGYQHFFGDDFCIEIEKVASHLYSSLLHNEKIEARKKSLVDAAKNEIFKLARFIYNASIEKLAIGLNSKGKELAEPKQVSAYFSAIVYEVVLDEAAKYRHQAASISALIDIARTTMNVNGEKNVDESLSPIQKQYHSKNHIADVLENWSETWVISRVKGVEKGDNASVAEDTKERLIAFKQKVYEKVDNLIHSLHRKGNKVIKHNERAVSLEKMKERLKAYFAIHLDDEKVEIKKYTLDNSEKIELPF